MPLGRFPIYHEVKIGITSKPTNVCTKKKGDGGLQKEIGGIQILVEIFQKKLLNCIFGGAKLHLG